MSQSRSEQTRQRVVEALRMLLLEKAVSEITMQEIQQRSGVSNGSIFHHFGSKDRIFQEIFVSERRVYLGEVAAAILGFEGDPCDAFGEGAAAATRYHARDPHRFLRLVLAFSNTEWQFRNEQVWVDLAEQVQRPVVEWAMPHFASGALPMMHPAAFQTFMLGPPELLMQSWVRRGMPGRLADYAPSVAEFVAGGLRALRAAALPPPGG